MNEDSVSTLITVVGMLFAPVIGGIITYFSISRIEHQKWQRERQEKFLSLKRDALATALEWIEPIRNAKIRASSLLMAAIRGDIDNERFLKDFPHLLGELVKKDLSADQRAVLPNGVYARGHHIVCELDEVRYLGVKYGQEARVKGKPLAGFQECSAKLDAIDQQINELETELRGEFRRTFG
jgi:hypothetical protein